MACLEVGRATPSASYSLFFGGSVVSIDVVVEEWLKLSEEEEALFSGEEGGGGGGTGRLAPLHPLSGWHLMCPCIAFIEPKLLQQTGHLASSKAICDVMILGN